MTTGKKLQGAIVGYGFISSKGHMPAYIERMQGRKDVEIIAVCDVCSDRKKEIPDGVRFYSDYEKLFEQELNLDFIDISTHPNDHYKIAKQALLKGLHVLCEKPLTTTIEDAYDLIQTAIRCKRVLFPCHNYKYAPVITAIRDIVKSGKIGKVKSITLNTFRNTHAVGTKEWKPNWRREKEYSGGGIAMDHGSHSLYLAFDWLGGYPKSVTASGLNYAFPKYDTEDNFFAIYQFDNGDANLHLSWTAGVRKVIYTLQGGQGAITVDDDKIQLAIMKNIQNKNSSHNAEWIMENYSIASDWMDSSHTHWFNTMFDQFQIAIKENNFLNKDIVDAYYCIQSIVKAYESINLNSLNIAINNNIMQTGGSL
jgi:predicted dehydrogenase